MTKYFITATILFAFFSCKNEPSQKNTIDNTHADSSSRQQLYSFIDEIGRRIIFQNYPPTNIVSITYHGSYAQHIKAFPTLEGYAFKNYHVAGACMGIYPDDPDEVPEKDLVWELAIRIIPGKAEAMSMHDTSGSQFEGMESPEKMGVPLMQFKKPTAPFKLKQLDSIQSITLTSTVGKAAKDGLALQVWLLVNGFVKAAPTRMEYAMVSPPNPLDVPVKIIIPVRKRQRSIDLKE